MRFMSAEWKAKRDWREGDWLIALLMVATYIGPPLGILIMVYAR